MRADDEATMHSPAITTKHQSPTSAITQEPDLLGDALGIIDYGKNSICDDVVSARWVARRTIDAASSVGDLRRERERNAVLGDDLQYVGDQFRSAAALHNAWDVLSGDSGRARAGDILDVVQLYLAGRGSIDELASAALRGDFRTAPRDEDEGIDLLAIGRLEQLAEDAALAEGTFSVRAAVDILERNLRCQARRLASAPPGAREFDRLGNAVDDLREILVGAAAFRALSQGEAAVKARDLGDVIEVYRARRGTISKIAADVLAGVYRDHPRDDEGELLFDGILRKRGRQREAWIASERWFAGSRNAPERQP
jgi:hypothetical protein